MTDGSLELKILPRNIYKQSTLNQLKNMNSIKLILSFHLRYQVNKQNQSLFHLRHPKKHAIPSNQNNKLIPKPSIIHPIVVVSSKTNKLGHKQAATQTIQ